MHSTNRRFGRLTVLWAALWALQLAAGCSDPATSTKAPAKASADASSGGDVGKGGADTKSADGSGPAADATATTAPAVKLTLTSLDPPQGRTSGGQTVTLYGSGFNGDLQVLLGGTPIQQDDIILVDSTIAQITTPPHEAGLVYVQVLIPGPSKSDPPYTAKMDDAFLYYNDLVVTKIEPAEGPATGGTAIAITGTGFSGNTKVLIGGKPAIGVQVVADDQVLATTPPGVYGSQPVHVVNERGAGLLKNGFFYTAAPTVTSLSPAAGPTLGGSQVTVYGTGLDKNTQLRFGEALATLTEVGKGFVKVVTPPGQGLVDVSAKSKYGQATLAGGYVYVDDQGTAATKILSIAPKQGPVGGGGQVAVVATGLVAASDTTLLIGNKVATILSVSAKDHVVLATVPKAMGPGPVDVSLQTSKGSDVAAGGYTYTDTLSLSAVSPASGPPEGNTKITIKGTGFSKGAASVKVGALPAAAVAVVSDTEIQAVTPPGSPGYVDVAVFVGADKAVLKGAYVYTAKNLQIYVPYPATGAQAGGTFVHLYGTGFTPSLEVRFGGNVATHFTFLDSSHVTVKTPPGKVGAVDVEVATGGLKSTLPKGYTYFNPMSAYGGTWGSGIDGAVNVTVLDAKSGGAIPDAFTMLWTNPSTPYQGFTNADGQITFSGEDVYGKQMVSASKTGYESASVVLFDAANVTLLMTPIPPPSPGAPPPGSPPPTVSGKVVGLDKYVFVPVGSCTMAQQQGQAFGGVCNSCVSDSGCGTGQQCIDIGSNNGKRCVQSCDGGCGNGFKCYAFGEKGACAPSGGEITSVCYHSKGTILDRDNYPPEGAGFEATPAKNFKYKIVTSYGEQAIVCFGGYKTAGAVLTAGDAQGMQAFTATVMGVKRHLMVVPNEKFENVDVFLNIPLTAKANVRLDKPPVWPLGPSAYGLTAAWAYLVFDGDGAIKLPDQDQKFIAPFQDQDPDKLVINQLPAALAGDIHDCSLSMLGLDVEISPGGTSQVPVSITVKNGIKELGNDAMVRRLAGSDFETVPTGVQKNIYGMWGSAKDDIYAVGAEGTLVHWNGGGWTVQAAVSGGKADLRGIYGANASHVWLVGWAGTMAAFSGTGWKAIPMLSGAVNLNGVYGAALPSGNYDVWAASASGLFRVVDNGGNPGLQKYNPSPFGNFLGIHGADASHVWAVGMYGTIAAWDGAVWKTQSSGTSIALRSVWAAGPAEVYAVGEAGQILRYDGQAWKAMSSPTTQTLYAVWGTSGSDVWAAGAFGTLVHYDGKKWTTQKIGKVDKNLLAVWATPAGDIVAMGEQELLLGPMLYPPLADIPVENGVLTGNTISWKVDPATVEPHFNYVTIGIPGMGGDTPVWNIMAKGSVSQVELPDFPAIQGTPGIPKGTPLHLTMIRGYKEGFDIDHYDNTDLNTLSWRSWSLHTFMFTRQ